MSASEEKQNAADQTEIETKSGEISKAQLFETFDFLPNLSAVFQDMHSAETLSETMRVGDVASTAAATQLKYANAKLVLQSLHGIERSLSEQQKLIEDSHLELKTVSDTLSMYSKTLFQGSLNLKSD